MQAKKNFQGREEPVGRVREEKRRYHRDFICLGISVKE
jgi:hypothetical protein